jgi:transposase
MGAHNTEGMSVGNYHFNKAKSLRELAEIIQRSYYTVQYIVEMYEKENRPTSKVRKSAMNIFTVYNKIWILSHIKNNTNLSATKLSAETKKHLHKKLIVREVK